MKFKVRVGSEEREVDISVNEKGNLVLKGIGSVYYELLNEELEFWPVHNTED